MVANALQTNPREVRDLLGAKLLVNLLVLWVLPSIVVWHWPLAYGRWTRRVRHNVFQVLGAVVALVVLVLASFAPLSSTMRNHKEVRYLINPLNSAYAMGYLATKPFQRDESVIEAVGLDAHRDQDQVRFLSHARPYAACRRRRSNSVRARPTTWSML